MADKQIKIWLSVFVFTLMAVGSAASYFAQGKTFYRGTEALEKYRGGSIEYSGVEMADELQASVLNVETENFLIPAEAEISNQDDIPPKVQPVSSPCANDEKPIIKNGQISGCTNNNTPLQITNYKLPITNPLPAPKIKILTEPIISYNLQPTTYNLTSCESQNLFTYTGPDRPGLLYGMCINCESSQYIINGGKCHPELVEG